MSDRSFVTMILVIGVVVVAGLVASVRVMTGEPREAAHGATGHVATDLTTMDDLAVEVRRLAEVVGRGGGGTGVAHKTTPEPGEILVAWSDLPVPLDDPVSRLWDDAPATRVALEPQRQAMPMRDGVSVPDVEIRALTDGRRIAWRLSWADATDNWFLEADMFCDQAAIQLPLVDNAAFTMGAPDFPVQIMLWKAIWQKDVDEGFQDVQDLHPNYWTDLYWFADGEFPQRVPEDFMRTEARDWFVAYRTGNPTANFDRSIPVDELYAEGFGSLTPQEESASVGRGVYDDGRWHVVIGRPLETADRADFQFRPGVRNVVAFAIWEGGDEDAGGRKHHSQWIPFEVTP